MPVLIHQNLRFQKNLFLNPQKPFYGEIIMEKERLLSYSLAQKLTESDLDSVSGAGSGQHSHVTTFDGADTIDDNWQDIAG